MWAAHDARQQREGGGSARDSDQAQPSGDASEEAGLRVASKRIRADGAQNGAPDGDEDEDLEVWLSAKRARGQGATGPQADIPGPFLDPAELYNEDLKRDGGSKRPIQGPERPEMVGSGACGEEGLDQAHVHSTLEIDRKRRRSATGKATEKSKRKKRGREKEKKSKHKKRRSKEKKRRKERRRSSSTSSSSTSDSD